MNVCYEWALEWRDLKSAVVRADTEAVCFNISLSLLASEESVANIHLALHYSFSNISQNLGKTVFIAYLNVFL